MEALLLAIGTVAGVVLSGLGRLMDGWFKGRRDQRGDLVKNRREQLADKRTAMRARRADALKEWQGLVVAQGERNAATISELQTAVNSLRAENINCREESAELRTALYYFHNLLERNCRLLRDRGYDPGEVPPMPPDHGRAARHDDAEVLARQATQTAILDAHLTQEASKVIAQPPP